MHLDFQSTNHRLLHCRIRTVVQLFSVLQYLFSILAVDHAFYKILSMQNRMLASFAFRGGMLFNRFFRFHVLQWIIQFYIPIQQHVLFYMQVPTILRQISHFHLSLSPISFLSVPIFLFCLKDGTSLTTSLHLLLASMSSKSDLFRKKPYILINIHIIYIYIYKACYL